MQVFADLIRVVQKAQAGHRGETEEDRELGHWTNARTRAGNRCSETEEHRVSVSLTH